MKGGHHLGKLAPASRGLAASSGGKAAPTGARPRRGSTREALGEFQRLEQLHFLFSRRGEGGPLGGKLLSNGGALLLQALVRHRRHRAERLQQQRAGQDVRSPDHVFKKRPTATKLPLNPSAPPPSKSSQATEGLTNDNWVPGRRRNANKSSSLGPTA